MIRTTNQLVDAIAADFVWRRRELTQLRGLINSSDGDLHSQVLIRSAVALLYAHWEGFVKKTSGFYLELVASKRLTYEQLTPNFVALSLKGKFEQLRKAEKLTIANEIANHFCLNMGSRCALPYKKGIDTYSNLSSKVLIDILNTLGLKKNEFSTKLQFIDNKLVNPRNFIAHGENLQISDTDYLALHDEVIALLELFRTEVENSAVLEGYLRR